MATRRRFGAGVFLLVCLTGWSTGPWPAKDPDLSENWYPLACRVWAGHLRDNVAELRAAGRIDPPDALIFESAIRRGGESCARNGFATLRLLFSLDEALRDWPKAEKGM